MFMRVEVEKSKSMLVIDYKFIDIRITVYEFKSIRIDVDR